MNERIKQLADEAGLYDFVIESMGINEEMEKFAELIVRECIGVCEEYHGTAGDQAARYIGQGINEHFGVEE